MAAILERLHGSIMTAACQFNDKTRAALPGWHLPKVVWTAPGGLPTMLAFDLV